VQFGKRPPNGIYAGVRTFNKGRKIYAGLRVSGPRQQNAKDGSGKEFATKAEIGAGFKKLVRKPGPWEVTFGGRRVFAAKPRQLCRIDKERVDAWGVGLLKIHCEWRENEKFVCCADMIIPGGGDDGNGLGQWNIRPNHNSPPGIDDARDGNGRIGADPNEKKRFAEWTTIRSTTCREEP